LRSVQRALVEEISEPAHTAILTKNTEFSGMFLLEIGRGCRNFCRFCMARCLNSPVRIVQEEKVVNTARTALSHTGRVGFIAPVLTDHPGLIHMVRSINEMGLHVSFSSLRADDFTEGIAGLMRQNGQNSVTFAPETGSVELRRRMGKKLSDEELLKAVEIALSNGMRRIRFYFMYGLPGETESDIDAIPLFVRNTLRLFRGDKTSLLLSINPFVPKKETPLENTPLHPLSYYADVRDSLSESLGGLDQVMLRMESLRTLPLHYHLSVGDNRIGSLLGECIQNGSFRGFHTAASEIMGN
jgi:radical SAM superfamily enzyme YgiQ (UPF0313 family)